jgi:putative N6-adenine-specific DNA methylase
VPLKSFAAKTEDQLYKKVRSIQWDKYLSLGKTFMVDTVVNSPHFTHSHYVALKVKDAIVDQFRDKTGQRPSIDLENPSVRINVYIDGSECIVSLDSSGDSLHRRNYRVETIEAPINEVLAAGMVLLSGWDRESSFTDPMCGSGTILIEAAMYARNIAPGIHRHDFGFTTWHDFDEELWKNIRSEVRQQKRDIDFPIIGADKSPKALNFARKNITTSGLEENIRLSNKSFQRRKPSTDKGTIIMNPPYGERMKEEDINEFYGQIGDTLKNYYAGHTAWILSANKEALKHIGLRTSKRYTLYNGPLKCKYHKYEMYQGSR